MSFNFFSHLPDQSKPCLRASRIDTFTKVDVGKKEELKNKLVGVNCINSIELF